MLRLVAVHCYSSRSIFETPLLTNNCPLFATLADPGVAYSQQTFITFVAIGLSTLTGRSKSREAMPVSRRNHQRRQMFDVPERSPRFEGQCDENGVCNEKNPDRGLAGERRDFGFRR